MMMPNGDLRAQKTDLISPLFCFCLPLRRLSGYAFHKRLCKLMRSTFRFSLCRLFQTLF